MSTATGNPFGARTTLETKAGAVEIYHLEKIDGGGQVDRLPFSIKVLLENLLRHAGRGIVGEADVRALADWNAVSPAQQELPFTPARVLEVLKA